MVDVMFAPPLTGRERFGRYCLWRLIGSIRRECTYHLIVLNEEHLRRILAKFSAYYNGWRPHVSLGKDFVAMMQTTNRKRAGPR
jgi:transposase InsO family protein